MAALDAATPSVSDSSERRERLARVATLAAIFLPAFGLLDVLLVTTLYPEVGFVRPLIIRAAGAAVALVSRSVALDGRATDRVAEVFHGLLLVASATMMALLGAGFGGPASTYVHGLSIAFIVRATVVPSKLRESLAYGGLLVVSYLAVIGGIFLCDEAARAAWSTTAAAVELLASLLVVIAVVLGGAVGSLATLSARNELSRARRIGRYRLEAPIGRGGQSEVWLAWDSRLGRQVALKLLPPNARGTDARGLFEREAMLASRLEGPHTVRVYDCAASDDGFSYLAMEYLPGEDLSTLVSTHGPLPIARAIHFGVQACRALEEAHAIGLVHRDVKPANLRVTRRGQSWDVLTLLDFGIARPLRGDGGGLTRGSTIRGTPAYMAPESCRGEVVTPSSDLYSLGATLYYLLAGTPPFVGDDFQLVSAHLADSPEPIAERRGGPVPDDVAAIVARCLAKRPEDRFASATALRQALERCGDAGGWSDLDAEAFWRVERTSLVDRYRADTQV